MSTIRTFDLTFTSIYQHLERLKNEISVGQLENLIKILKDTSIMRKRVFIYSVGRSLLVGKAFAMRLMHLGFDSNIISDIVTPPVGVNDIFLVISKNLSEGRIALALDKAKKYGAWNIIITSKKDTPLINKADYLLIIPDLAQKVKISGAHTPLGTLFEISAMVILDSIIAELMAGLGIKEKEMESRHANIQ